MGKILALNLEKSNIYQTQTTRPHLLQKISKQGSIQHYFSPSKKVKLKIWSTFSPTHQNICQRSSTLASSTLDLPHIRKVHMCDFQNFGLIFEEQYFFPLKRCVVFWNFFDWSCLDWRKMVILVLDHVTVYFLTFWRKAKSKIIKIIHSDTRPHLFMHFNSPQENLFKYFHHKIVRLKSKVSNFKYW